MGAFSYTLGAAPGTISGGTAPTASTAAQLAASRGTRTDVGFDMHIEGIPDAMVHGSKGLWFGNYPLHVGVKGVQKLVDRFTKCFLTPLGSDLTDLNYGTLVAASFGNSIGGRTTLRQLVAMSVQQAEATLRRYDAEYAVPDDERLASAAMESVELTAAGDGFDVYVRIKNVAGTNVMIMISDAFARNP